MTMASGARLQSQNSGSPNAPKQSTGAIILATELESAQIATEPDLAWELVKEECHDVLEQLPNTLQRNFKLMKELDEQVAAHLQAIPAVLQQYLQLRLSLAEKATGAETAHIVGDDVPGDRDGDGRTNRAASMASFSSASLTPITDSPPSDRSTSLPTTRHRGAITPNGFEEDEEDVEEADTSLSTQIPAVAGPSSTQLIARVASLAPDAVRGANEKLSLSNAAFNVIDRHIRALDIAIDDQQSAIAVGLRAGTRPSAVTIPPPSPTDVKSGPVPDNTALFALAEAASTLHAAQKTLDVLQPKLAVPTTTTTAAAATTTTTTTTTTTAAAAAVGILDEPAPEPPSTQIVVAENKPVSEEKPEVKPSSKPKSPKSQPKKKERRASSRKAIQAQNQTQTQTQAQTQEEDPNNVDDQKYCFCNRVSFGSMIACDGPNCQKEWFHWECVGITKEPTSSKWYCRDCEPEAKEPAKKKRKR